MHDYPSRKPARAMMALAERGMGLPVTSSPDVADIADLRGAASDKARAQLMRILFGVGVGVGVSGCVRFAAFPGDDLFCDGHA